MARKTKKQDAPTVYESPEDEIRRTKRPGNCPEPTLFFKVGQKVRVGSLHEGKPSRGRRNS